MKAASREDLVSGLIARSQHDVLERIFLSLSLQDLRHCRLTCKTWLDYLRQQLWAGRSLRVLLTRLEKQWRTEKHRRVELRVEGRTRPCQAQCDLNYPDCRCPLVCQLDREGHALVLLLNGREFRGSYSINDQTQFTRKKIFQRQQHQVKLGLKNDLELDTTSFLSRPIWMKKKSPGQKIKITGGKYMEVDSTFIRILDRDQTSEISRFIPYTGKFNYYIYSTILLS